MVTVTLNEDYNSKVSYEADLWSIDDDGRLHVVKDEETSLATFNTHSWKSVELEESA